MTSDSAERWVTISALAVAGIYAYRRLTEPAQPGKLKNVLGVGEPVPLGQFATAWGFTYLVVAVMASANPGLGGSFAILIATGDFLTNSASVFADVGKQTKTTAQKASSVPTVTVPTSPEGAANVPSPLAGTEGAAATGAATVGAPWPAVNPSGGIGHRGAP